MNGFNFNSSLLHLLHRASQIADDLFANHQELNDLTSRQFIVLAAIRGTDGISQTDITAATKIDRSTLTDLVSRLQARGLVERNRSRMDARSYEVRLTANGEALLEVAIPIVQQIDDILMRMASPEGKSQGVEMRAGIAAIASKYARSSS